MSPENRKAALARYVDGWTAEAIAKSLGVDVADVEAVLPGGAPAPATAAAAPVATRPAAPVSKPEAPARDVRVHDDNSLSVSLPNPRVGL